MADASKPSAEAKNKDSQTPVVDVKSEKKKTAATQFAVMVECVGTTFDTFGGFVISMVAGNFDNGWIDSETKVVKFTRHNDCERGACKEILAWTDNMGAAALVCNGKTADELNDLDHLCFRITGRFFARQDATGAKRAKAYVDEQLSGLSIELSSRIWAKSVELEPVNRVKNLLTRAFLIIRIQIFHLDKDYERLTREFVTIRSKVDRLALQKMQMNNSMFCTPFDFFFSRLYKDELESRAKSGLDSPF